MKKERIAAGLEDPVTSEESKEDEKEGKTGKNKNKKKGGSGKMLVTVSLGVKEDENTVIVSISPKKED